MKQNFTFIVLLLCLISKNLLATTPAPLKNKSSFQTSVGIKMISSSLYTASGNIADGNRVVFDGQYSNAVDGNDALKIMNPGENFGLLRNTKILSVEARQPFVAGDTLFYNMTNLIPQTYKLDIIPQNLTGSNISCELVDLYLNSRKNISLTDSNHFNVVITSDPASKAANRLLVVFGAPPIAAAFAFTSVSASNNNNKSILVTCAVNQELNIARYELERSSDDIQYSNISTTNPRFNDEHGGIYQFVDMSPLEENNFYRIRSIDKTGKSTYSDKVNVSLPRIVTSMNLYPNPVINKSFQIELNRMAPGKYYIKLTSNSGQQVFVTSLNIQGCRFTKTIDLSANVSKGDYNVTVWSEDGIVSTRRLIIQ